MSAIPDYYLDGYLEPHSAPRRFSGLPTDFYAYLDEEYETGRPFALDVVVLQLMSPKAPGAGSNPAASKMALATLASWRSRGLIYPLDPPSRPPPTPTRHTPKGCACLRCGT